MTRLIASGLALLTLTGLGVAAARVDPEPIPQPDPVTAVTFSPVAPKYRTVSHTVVEGETASEVLRGLNAPADALIRAAKGGLNRLSVGDVVQLDFAEGDPTPWRLRLDKGDPAIFALVRTDDAYRVASIPVPYIVETGPRTLTVTSSLWAAALDAGLRPSQIMSVANIFEYDVDFNTELLPGAVIQLAADTLTDEAGVSRIGDIRAARLTNGKKTFIQIKFRMADGTIGWFKPDGSGARKTFLRSPLAFSNVTSNFSTGRFHPVLKVKRPHYGVDFGAPTGTTVRAVADGVVTVAGRSGGHGNFVELDHDGPYSTSYSHLSVISVKRGQRISQGDVVGKVGATGLATGPHLHYQFMVNGKFVNPMTVDLPNSSSGEIPEDEKAAFFAVRDAVIGMVSP